MQTRTRSRSRSRRPVESGSCNKCPGCNDDARQPVSGSSNGTDEKRRKRSLSAASTPRNRERSKSRGRQPYSPPTTPLDVTNQLMNSAQASDQSTSTSTASLETTSASHETMKIDTKNYCLFCFKLSYNVPSGGDGVEEAGAAKRKEVCSRYLKLLTRHLDLDIYSHVATTSNLDSSFFSKTIKKDKGYFDIVACNACYSMCESFCEAYHKYQQAELEIGWNVMKMKDVMKSAEKVPSRINDFRRNVLEVDGGMKKQEKELMDGFRREFYRKCNRVKGYPKLVLKKHSGKLASANQRRATVGLQRFHQSTPIDMVRNPTASVQVLELGDELILTSRARPLRSKSVPPVPTKTPVKPTCNTPVSPQVPVRETSQHAPTNPNQAKTNPVISKPAYGNATPKKPNPSLPGPSSSRTAAPSKKSTKVIHVAKRVPAPSPQKCITVVDLCDSDDENDSEISKASPPKKSKVTTTPVVVEPVVVGPIVVVPEAPPLPNSEEGSRNMEVELIVEDNTGKDTGTALAGNQDDNAIVMEISSQSAPQPSEPSTSAASSYTTTSVRQIPEVLENPSNSYFFNSPQEPRQSSFSVNENPGIIPSQMDSQPTTGAFTNDFSYFSPHSQAQYEVPQDIQYDYDYTDSPQEATGTFIQHGPQAQPMDFEFPSPAPGTGIEFTVDPVSHGSEMCRISYTYTRTVTSTFSGIPPGNFGMPHAHIYPPHISSHEVPGQPPFYNTTQDHDYDPQNYYSEYVPEQFNPTPGNFFAPDEPVDPQPIVTEMEDEDNSANNLNEGQPPVVGFVAIAEVDDDSNDIQVIEEVCTGTQRGFTVTMNLRNDSGANGENNGLRNNMETITPPVYVCT